MPKNPANGRKPRIHVMKRKKKINGAFLGHMDLISAPL